MWGQAFRVKAYENTQEDDDGAYVLGNSTGSKNHGPIMMFSDVDYIIMRKHGLVCFATRIRTEVRTKKHYHSFASVPKNYRPHSCLDSIA